MSNKSKKGDPSSRAKSTSTLNSAPAHTQPLPPHPSLSSFNPSKTHFAAVVSAGIAGGQRLRCWDVERSSIVKEWDLPLDVKEGKRGARAVFWARMALGGSSATISGEVDGEEDGSSKKKRKRKSASGQTGSGNNEEEVDCVVVVQAASMLYYTTGQTGAKPAKVVNLSTTPSTAIALTRGGEHHILTVSSTTFEIVDPVTGSVQLSTPLPDGFTPASVSTSTSSSTPIAISVLDDSAEHVNIAIASTNLTVLTLPLPLSASLSSKEKVQWTRPQSISIEPIRTIVALPLGGVRFVTVEEESRVGTVWSATPNGSGEQIVETIATIPSPTSEPIHNISVSINPESDEMEMYATSMSGEISIYTLDASSFTATQDTESTNANSNSLSSSKKKRGKKSAPVPALKPVSKVSVVIPSLGNEDVGMRILACVSAGESSQKQKTDGGMDVDEETQEEIVVGWMGGVGRVRWEKIRYREFGGGIIPEVVIKRSGQELVASESAEGAIPLQRFKESTAGANNNATRALMTEEEKNLAQKDLELPVEGDLADLTLGERLAVLEPDHVPSGARSSERRSKKAEDGDVEEEEEEGQDGGQKLGPQSTQSLTRLLLQALHTSDPSLLTLILTSPQNSTPGMIRNTIRKLPASMALPLLKACVERLGKGRGFEKRGGGRGGGLGGKEGGCVVAWIRGVLVERGSILMTIPSLPVHLASLSQLLQSRLQLHTPLLSLSGRLDLALAQIELRKSLVPPKPKRQGTFYVEGESETDDDDEDSDDDEDMDSDVEIEGDEEDIGEVEDVRLESRRETESRSAGGDDDEADGEIRVRALNGRKGKASRELLVASDDEDEEEEEDEEDEEDDDDEDEYDEDDDSEDDRPRGLIDDEADEASDDEDEDEDMEE